MEENKTQQALLDPALPFSIWPSTLSLYVEGDSSENLQVCSQTEGITKHGAEAMHDEGEGRLFWRGDIIFVQNPRLEEVLLAGLRQRFPELEPGEEGPLPREKGKFRWGRARWWDPHRACEQEESALGRLKTK